MRPTFGVSSPVAGIITARLLVPTLSTKKGGRPEPASVVAGKERGHENPRRAPARIKSMSLFRPTECSRSLLPAPLRRRRSSDPCDILSRCEHRRSFRRRASSAQNFQRFACAFRIGPIMLSQTFRHCLCSSVRTTYRPFHGAKLFHSVKPSKKKIAQIENNLLRLNRAPL